MVSVYPSHVVCIPSVPSRLSRPSGEALAPSASAIVHCSTEAISPFSKEAPPPPWRRGNGTAVRCAKGRRTGVRRASELPFPSVQSYYLLPTREAAQETAARCFSFCSSPGSGPLPYPFRPQNTGCVPVGWILRGESSALLL